MAGIVSRPRPTMLGQHQHYAFALFPNYARHFGGIIPIIPIILATISKFPAIIPIIPILILVIPEHNEIIPGNNADNFGVRYPTGKSSVLCRINLVKKASALC